MFYLRNDLCDFLKDKQNQYLSNQPFPHIVIDGLCDPMALQFILDEFLPPSNESAWWKYDNVLEKKLAKNQIHELHSISELIGELHSNYFVSFLERLTGIEGLIVDHTLNGGGLHQSVRGGKLDIHADYNYHPITKLDRRLNVLLYLNEEWASSYGGNLELWKPDMSACEVSIKPLFNRMVIFSVTDQAYHGHPEPLTCPDDRARKSIALYYYTNGRPAHEVSPPHSTIFKRRPSDPISDEHEQLRRQRAVRRLT